MDRDGERARVSGFVVASFEQERDLKRSPPWRRELRQHLDDGIPEQVAERRVCKPLLGLRRSGAEHPQPPLACSRHPGQPERRLADPGVAFEHDSGRPIARPVEEGVQRGNLVLPTDDLDSHLEPMLTRSGGDFECGGAGHRHSAV